MNIIDTLTSQTTAYVNELITNIFLPRIVKYVNERDPEELLTTKEVSKVLSLPVLKPKNTSFSSKRCIWEFKRGKYRGEVCNKKTVEGSEYCASCIKRITFTRKTSYEELSTNDSIPLSEGEKVLDTKFYDKERGLIHFNSYIIRIHQCNGESDMFIVGKLNEYDQLVKLTPEECAIVTEDGYLIDDDYL